MCRYTMSESFNGVYRFLEQLNLGRYWEIFKAKGYDRETDIQDLDATDMEQLGITGQDKERLLEAAVQYRPGQEFGLQCWLEEQGLGYYLENLRVNDVTDVTDLEHVELTDDVLDEMEISMPGHRKRLRRAVNQLRKRRRRSEPEEPVARGYWGKPPPLQDAKNDFLCVQATLVSTSEQEKNVTLDFMVDSGSDVVTVRSEVLDTLGLELIGAVQSRGVHATKEKQLYRGLLRLGSVTIEAEVMAETYDSIGNQVLRNFRHYIDAQRHYWLKSDFRYPPPSMFERRTSGEASGSSSVTASPTTALLREAMSQPIEITKSPLLKTQPSQEQQGHQLAVGESETEATEAHAQQEEVQQEVAGPSAQFQEGKDESAKQSHS